MGGDDVMQRHRDWKNSLADFIFGVQNVPYQIGVNDCYTFAFGCVDAMTGNDLSKIYESKYRTVMEGLRIIHESGGMKMFVSSVLGTFPRPFCNQLQPFEELQGGDLVLFYLDRRYHVGVVWAQSVMHPTDRGLMGLRNISVDCYWRI